MSNPHGLVLYDNASSPCARRVRITLLEKSLAWRRVEIDLSRLEQRRPEYLAINPSGLVPSLAHGERVVFESNVITDYLDDAFPEHPLYPTDPWERAQVRMWQAAELAMAKDFRPLMYARAMGPLVRLTRTLDEALALARRSTSDPADLHWEERVWSLAVLTDREEAALVERLTAWLELVERALEGRTWLVADRFGQADVSVYPRVAMYAQAHVPIPSARFPRTWRWMRACAGRDSFRRSLSREARMIARLLNGPIVPWVRTLLRGERRVWPGEGLALRVLRAAMRRVMRVDALLQRGDAPERPIPRPACGSVPPEVRPRRGASPGATHSAPITLLGDARSPHFQRIAWLLRLRAAAFSVEPIDLTRLEHKGPRFRAINPLGEVPALVHGDRRLYDSTTIAEYLDDTLPPTDFRGFPADAHAAARVRTWLAFEQGLHKECRPLLWTHRLRADLDTAGVAPRNVEEHVADGVPEAERHWLRSVVAGEPRFDTSATLARTTIETKLVHLETRLAAASWLVGDAPTFADVAWATRLVAFPDMGMTLDRGRFPGIARWLDRATAALAP